jgi:hypothetical protein
MTDEAKFRLLLSQAAISHAHKLLYEHLTGKGLLSEEQYQEAVSQWAFAAEEVRRIRDGRADRAPLSPVE